MANWKRCLDSEMDAIPIDEIVAKAEELDVQEEIAHIMAGGTADVEEPMMEAELG